MNYLKAAYAKLIEYLTDVGKLKHFHAAMTIIWLLLVIPTIFWWPESVLWVALMSVWANVAGHWSAWQATRSEEKQDEN